MRSKKAKQGYYLITCDVCYKTDIDSIHKTGKLGIMWNDRGNDIILCDTCKKKEELKHSDSQHIIKLSLDYEEDTESGDVRIVKR